VREQKAAAISAIKRRFIEEGMPDHKAGEAAEK